VRNDTEADERDLAGVPAGRNAKRDGYDGTWAAHPTPVPIAMVASPAGKHYLRWRGAEHRCRSMVMWRLGLVGLAVSRFLFSEGCRSGGDQQSCVVAVVHDDAVLEDSLQITAALCDIESSGMLPALDGLDRELIDHPRSFQFTPYRALRRVLR